MSRSNGEGRPTARAADAQEHHQDQPTTRLDQALAYVERGWVPVPSCSAPCTTPWHNPPCPGKRPLVKIKDRSTVIHDEARRWWRRWPDAGVAILTGARSNLVVVDLDGEDGEASWKRIEAEHGPFPHTMEVRTKRGRHLYFTHPGGKVLTRKGDDFYPRGREHGNAHGVDVRGDGGLVIAPPSRDRVLANDLDPAPLPAGLVEPFSTGTAAAALDDGELAEALDQIRTKGDPCSCMVRALDKRREGGRYPAARDAQYALVQLGREQHPGAAKALDQLRDAFLAEKPEGEREWNHALDGAVAAAMAAVPEATGCPYILKEHDLGGDETPDLGQLLDAYAAGKRELAKAEVHKRTQAILDAALDATDLDQLPEPIPLLGDWLNRAEYVLLSGKFGTYKSFVALAWAYCIATGQVWSCGAVPEAQPVVYVAAEGVAGIKKRLRALERLYGVKVPQGMLTIIRRPVHLTNPKEMIGLATIVAQRQAKLIILDTWHRMTPGIEENSATETGGPLDQLLTLRDNYGATVLVIHHTGHAQRHARGSSALEDDADGSWMVRLGEGEDEEGRGPGTPRTLVHRKSKDGEVTDPARLRLLVDDQGQAVVDVDPLQLADPVPARRLGRPPKRDHGAEVRELIQALDEIKAPVEWGYRRIREWDADRRPGQAATERACREAADARQGRAKALVEGEQAWNEIGQEQKGIGS